MAYKKVNNVTQQNKKQPEEPLQGEVEIAAEMQDLKRDMRSAKLVDWLQKNQQQLLAGAVVIVLALAAGGLWAEKQKTYKQSAAIVYYQALAVSDDKQRQALLETIVSDYPDTAYATLAHTRLATLGDREVHLRAVMTNDDAMPELKWQARLDLAEWFIESGKLDEAKSLLVEKTGKQFEELRFYLLAQTLTGSEKTDALQKALDAVSNDSILKAEIEAQLASQKVGQ